MSLIKRALDKAEEEEKQDNTSDDRAGEQGRKFEGITGLEILLGAIIVLSSAFIGGQIILLILWYTG
ncbi:MAG: hypothetical protein ACQEP7_01945 [bacterium]